MKIIGLLLKNYILDFTKYNEFKYGDITYRERSLLQYLLVILAFAGVSGLWVYRIWQVMSEMQNSLVIANYILVPVILIAVLLAVFSSAMKGAGILYLDNNLDALFSMPIETYKIIIAKLGIIYVYVFIICFILIYPPVIYYGIIQETSIFYYLIQFAEVVLLPILPMNIGILIGLLIYRIFKCFQFGNFKIKTAIEMVILFLGICLIIWCTSNPEIIKEVLLFVQEKSGRLTTVVESILFLNFKIIFMCDITIFLLGSLSFYIINLTYRKQCSELAMNRNKIMEYKYEKLKQHSIIYSLVARERNRYFSIPVYVINTMLGIFCVVIYIVAIIVTKDNLISYFLQINRYLQIKNPLGVFNACVLTSLISLTNITYASISIEGKSHELIKVYPIKGREFFMAKILLHLSLTVPTLIIANTISVIILKLEIGEMLIGFILPLSFTIFVGILGCIINTLLPNFEWQNVTYIVKQSMAAILSIFVGIGVVGICLWILISKFSNYALMAMYVLAVIILIINVLITLLFAKKAEKFYTKL